MDGDLKAGVGVSNGRSDLATKGQDDGSKVAMKWI